MEVGEKIIKRASELMMQFGTRTVTMDDISRDLGISKSIIYQYFKDKKELVNRITSLHLQIEEEAFCFYGKSEREQCARIDACFSMFKRVYEGHEIGSHERIAKVLS